MTKEIVMRKQYQSIVTIEDDTVQITSQNINLIIKHNDVGISIDIYQFGHSEPRHEKIYLFDDFEPIERLCDTCGKHMTEGYCADNGEEYYCSDECLFVDGYTKELFEEDFENDDIYWTKWEND